MQNGATERLICSVHRAPASAATAVGQQLNCYTAATAAAAAAAAVAVYTLEELYRKAGDQVGPV